MKERYNSGKFLLEIAMAALAVLFLAPLYLVFINAFKRYDEVLSSTASLPESFRLSNFVTVWQQIHFPTAFQNSLTITVISVLGILLVSSAAAYQIVRRPGKLSNIIFLTILASMVIPFQTMMIPLLQVAKDFHLINSLYGIIIMYLGFGIPLALFLYHGFIKGIPIELEEAATIDGCNTFGVYFRILLPLLAPITTTIAILHSLWIWNDFLLPYIVLGQKSNQTIPLASYVYFGEYMNEWHLALAALTMAVIPVIAFFLLMQKYIIQGITAGAVKG
ncbi:carbohydrate ABC transporter permease [Paenibacillus sabinae]|uniref:Putative starch degradation products transport system permease protein amyC n=1 Tax=Paenibacillus sabinae T27 TaxID=1268072 RepID=X4ZFI6_9BACL|nr:carbohydrate ABC transporter permease [Paenibacillus sabinae]AHV96207.1 putative starch degradation products transport system permease protein amyC [Paenibacillus sabinae T27]